MASSITELYIENISAHSDRIGELVASGNALPLIFRVDEEIHSTPIYLSIDNPHSISKTSLVSSIHKELPVILRTLMLYQTPQAKLAQHKPSLLQSESSRLVEMINEDNPLGHSIVVMSHQYKGSASFGVMINGKYESLVNLEIMKLNKSLIQLMIHKNEQRPLTHFFPKMAFRYFNELGSMESIDNVRNKIAELHRFEPTPIAYLLLMPNHYYRSETGKGTIVRNYFRQASSADNLEELQSEINTFAVMMKRYPELRKVSEFQRRMIEISKYVEGQGADFDSTLKLERAFISGATKAFRLTHYENTLMDIVVSSKGLLRVTPFEWTSFTDLSLQRDFPNALFESLLPEVSAQTIDKNPLNRIKNATALIGNVCIQEIPVSDVFKLHDSSIEFNNALEKEWKRTTSPLNSTPSHSYHKTSLSNDMMFKGYFEGIPSADQERFDKQMRVLMQSEYGAKLSGAQFKLPVILSKSNNILQLRRQQGNGGFTHIAKMPMPGLDTLTLAEWLPLRLLKEAGFNVAKNQLVSFDEQHTPYNDMLQNGSIEQSIGESATYFCESDDDLDTSIFEGIAKAFGSIKPRLNNRRQTPPFLISERFDIPYANESTCYGKTLSLDLASLCLATSSQKYSMALEDVAIRLKSILPQSQFPAIAEDIYKQIIGSYLLHNNDLHLKNITILAKEEVNTGAIQYEVSPIYDVIIAPLVFPEAEESKVFHQALSIHGTKYPSAKHIINFANTSLELSVEKSERIFTQSVNDIRAAIGKVRANLPMAIIENEKWLDTVNMGLALVERNLNYIQKSGAAYGHQFHQPTHNMTDAFFSARQ